MVLIWRSEELAAYGFEDKPWFRPRERQPALLEEIERRGLGGRVTFRASRAASDEELAAVHDPAHVAWVVERCRCNEGALDQGATPARAEVERAARHVAGSVLDAVDALIDGEAKRAFVPIAGFHHARRAEARMYCLYNDPALALRRALDRLPGATIGYADVDVHQGDGVYELLAEETRVALVDLHESWRTLWPHSPDQPASDPVRGDSTHTGVGAAFGTKLNVELAPGTTDDQFLARWEEAEAFLEARRPALIVFEAGVDHLKGDSFGHLDLSERCVRHVTERLLALAERHAEGRILVLGGGAYSADGVRRGWGEVLEALTG